MIRKLILFAAFFALAPFTAEAKTIYVNNSGSPACSDSTAYASNSASSPWCTLGRALWGNANRSTPNPGQAAVAGDTVLVTAGTYTAPGTGTRFGVAFNPVNAGTSEGARIIIQAVGTVNLRSTGTAGGPIIGSNGKNYITWDGFTVDETTYYSLGTGEQGNCVVNAANYVTIKNCTLIGNTSAVPDQNHHAIFYSESNYGYIYNNTIRDVKGPDENVAGIYEYGSDNLLIEHNNIYNCSSGIWLKGSVADSITVRFNKIYDVTNIGIRNGATTGSNTNHLIYQNLIYNAGDGIVTYYNVGAGNKIVNNTLYNVSSGFRYHNESTQVLWYNNIVHTARISSVRTNAYTVYPTVHDWEHNLYYNTTVQWRLDSDGQTQNWAYWTGTWNQDTVGPAGRYGSNPLFANIAGRDFRLCTAAGVPHVSCSGVSPALTLGVDILNLAGRGTSAIIPAGAYITGNETIGITTGISAPPNFRRQ
jgi:hypothetical protein